MNTRKLGKFSSLVVALLSATTAGAITLDNTNTGWYDSTGGHVAQNPNYAAGYISTAGNPRAASTDTGCAEFEGAGILPCPAVPVTFNDFFVFDLSGISGTVTAATLHITNFAYISPDASETYRVNDFTGNIAALVANAAGAIGTFNDLGGGTAYGSYVATAANSTNAVLDIPLNAAALADIAAHLGGQIAFGGNITTLSGDFDQLLFTGTSGNFSCTDCAGPHQFVQLTLTTAQQLPEPGTLLALSGVLGGLYLTRRCKAKRSPDRR